MNINGKMLFLIFLSPRVSEGPQKPQTLTASKTKYEKFGPKIPFMGNLKKPPCASIRDVLELATFRYID